MATYSAIRLEGKGGVDQLRPVDLPLVDPGPGQVRVRVEATGVGATDLVMRTGNYPYAPPFPFVPGYDVVGVVDAVGAEANAPPLLERPEVVASADWPRSSRATRWSIW